MSNTVNNYTETDLGNISLNPRGEYDDSADYEYLDAVSYQGGSYFCLAELETTITGIAPDAGRNSEHWQMIAAPGDMTPEYTAAYNNVINKAVQVEASRAAVELAQQEIETSQADVQELHSDTVQAAQEAENSKNSAANSAQSAEQSKNAASESEQNVNNTLVAFDDHVEGKKSEADAAINKTKDAAIKAVMDQQSTSVQAVKDQTASYITEKETSAKTEIGNYTSEKIAEINKKASEANITLANTITDGNSLKTQLETTISTADTSKKNLDASNTVATKTKADLDTSNTTATKTKADLDTSNTTASETKTGLDATNKTAAGLVTSLGDKIAEGTQVKNDIQTTGETAMSNLQAEAAKQQEYIKASIDDTLSISGKAADAAVTGKKISSLKEALTSKADKTALVKTDRKLDALWKLNQGISYEFQTDDAEAYQKMVQSGAKVASIKSIGGKTIVWNQLLGTGYEDTKTANGITFTNNGDGSITIDGTAATNATFQINKNKSFVLCSGHKYLWNVGAIVNGVSIGNNNYTKFYKRNISAWNATLGKYNGYNCIKVENGTTVSNLTIRPRLFDLTLMFGLGNEPSTPEEFEDMFPADYYPHNAGELMSVPVNEVMEQGKNLFDQNKESNLLRCSLDRDNIVKTDVSLHPILKIDGLKIGTTYTISYNTALKTSLSDSMLLYSLSTKEATYPSGDFKHEVGAGKTDYNVKLSFSAPQETIYFIGSIMPETISKFQVEESSSITEYKPYRKTSHTIPSVVIGLDGYGDGIDNVCNYVDWENKKYHKRIGRYVVTGDEQFYSNQTYIGDNSSNAYMDMDIGQKQSTDAKLISNKLLYSKWCWSEDRTYDAICLNNTQIHIRISNSSLGITNEASPVETQNATKKYCKNLHESGDPIIIYYELAEEEIIDISDIIGDTFQKPLEVESGGTLMFRNTNGDDYRIPVPNTEEYLVSLAEVAK